MKAVWYTREGPPAEVLLNPKNPRLQSFLSKVL